MSSYNTKIEYLKNAGVKDSYINAFNTAFEKFNSKPLNFWANTKNTKKFKNQLKSALIDCGDDASNHMQVNFFNYCNWLYDYDLWKSLGGNSEPNLQNYLN